MEHLSQAQGTALLRAALTDLPDRQRAALALSYFDGLPASRAAAVMSVSVAAFEAMLVRGRRGLRRALATRGFFKVGDVW